MPLTKKGQSILAAMHGTYKSDKKAKQVMYSMVNAGKLKGVHK